DVVLVGLLPGEQRTQFLTGGLDRVALLLLTKSQELLRTVVLVVDEALSEGAGLDVGQDTLHTLLHTGVDDTRTRDVIAELSGVGDRPALLGDAALPHQVDDELELVQHLEVGDLGLVARLDKRFESGLHQVAHTTAEHGLLTEQVGLGLLGGGGRAGTGASAAVGLRVRAGEVAGAAGRVAVGGDDVRDTAARDELAPLRVAGSLGGDEDDVDALGSVDVAEAD